MEGFFPIPTDMRGLWTKGTHGPSRMNQSVLTRLMGERDSARAIAIAWWEAAKADGWASRPTFKHEAEDRHATIDRDGYKAHCYMRPNEKDHRAHPTLGNGEISVWCSKGISIRAPLVYPGFAYFPKAERTCPECGAEDVETFRVAFANRSCEACLPKLRASLERPGWND